MTYPEVSEIRTAKLRKHTVFEPCAFHERMYAEESRYRRAETMIEGGWGGSPCPATKCRMKPGTDFFAASFVAGNPVYEVLPWSGSTWTEQPS